MPKVFMINGLAIGEETKGVFVAWLTKLLNAKNLLRYGGCQAAHYVRQNGLTHGFSQYGSGTFSGAHTNLVNMVIDPLLLLEEREQLLELGVEEPFQKMSIHKDCLSITPFHRAISRFRELMRENKKGTIGMGVGEAVRDARNHPEAAITAADFAHEELLYRKVEAIRQQKLAQAYQLVSETQVERLEHRQQEELELLRNQELVSLTVRAMRAVANRIPIVGNDHFSKLFKTNQPLVVEGSHGVLLHPWYGFVPHTTQIDPTGESVYRVLGRFYQPDDVIRLGVFRSYAHRHGAGPLVSESAELRHRIMPEADNAEESWLGPFRLGPLDLVALRYGLACVGRDSFRGVMISHIDEMKGWSSWPICIGYTFSGQAPDVADFFEFDGEVISAIKVHPNTGDEQHLHHQQRLTELLWQCRPIIHELTPAGAKPLEEVFIEYVGQEIGLPVVAIGYGPTVDDRQIISGWEQLFYE